MYILTKIIRDKINFNTSYHKTKHKLKIMLASVWTLLSNVNPNTRKSRMPLTRFLSHKTGQELHKKSVSIHTHTWWFTIWLPLKHQSAKIITICEREKESFVSYEKWGQSVSRKRPVTGRKTHLLCRTDKKILLYPIWALSSYIPISFISLFPCLFFFFLIHTHSLNFLHFEPWERRKMKRRKHYFMGSTHLISLLQEAINNIPLLTQAS